MKIIKDKKHELKVGDDDNQLIFHQMIYGEWCLEWLPDTNDLDDAAEFRATDAELLDLCAGLLQMIATNRR